MELHSVLANTVVAELIIRFTGLISIYLLAEYFSWGMIYLCNDSLLGRDAIMSCNTN